MRALYVSAAMVGVASLTAAVPVRGQQEPAPPATPVAAAEARAVPPFAIASVVRADQPPPRGRRPSVSVLEAMAGDELRVTVTVPLPDGFRYEARFGGTGATAEMLHAPAWRENATTFVTEAPSVEAWERRELRLVALDARNGESANGFPLRIAPTVNAVVENISPAVAEFGSSIRVSGQGFFAPRDQIVLRVGEIAVPATRVSPAGDWFSVVVPATPANSDNNYGAGARDVTVTVWGVPAQVRVPELNEGESLRLTLWRLPGGATEVLIAGAALLAAAVIFGVIYGLYRTLQRRRGFFAALLFEPESQTYSLSRAQFFWWTVIIAYGYLFLFFGHGLHQGIWSFPPLEGFAYTFMISLATLLVAQVTTSVRGSKGAGVVHPTPADLIVHGGVLAPERVQQVVWTVLAGLGFLWIVFKTYASSTGLPPIPTEMLALMGISSAGYLGGKLARKPGPIIQRVEVSTGSVVLKIFGQHLSVHPRVLVDGVELSRDEVSTLQFDPDHRDEFVKALKVVVPDSVARTADEWYSRPRVLVLVNEDTQRAEWELEIPTVSSFDVGPLDAMGRRTVTISGEGLGSGAVLAAPWVAEEIPLVPDPAMPSSRWQASVPGSPTTPAEVVIKTANSARVAYTWPATAVLAPPPVTPGAAVPPTVTTPSPSVPATVPAATPAAATPAAKTPAAATSASPVDTAAAGGAAQADANRIDGDLAAEETGTSRDE